MSSVDDSRMIVRGGKSRQPSPKQADGSDFAISRRVSTHL
jgi:hypothetical protein